MRSLRVVVFLLGLTGLAALTVFAGAGAVLRAFTDLGPQGIFAITALHLPVLAILGLAWWFIGRAATGATPLAHIWARFVRDSASEVLPFSQAGGYLLGVRALQLRGVRPISGALSMSVDLVTELWGKLPYVAAGLIALIIRVPQNGVAHALAIAFILTIAVALAPVLLHGRLWRSLESLAQRISARWPEFAGRAPEEIRQSYDKLFAHRENLFAAFAIHVFCWFFGAVETWLLFFLMGVPVSPVPAIIIDSLVSTLRTFGFLVPAAAGIQEGAYVIVCALFGLPPATAVAVSFARRARDLAIAIPTFATWQYLEARRSSVPAEPKPAAAGLHRFWFRFRDDPHSPLGYGVTARSEDDARAILRMEVFASDLPAESELIVDVDVRTLDQVLVIPNMESPSWRGIWFPRGHAKPS